MKARFARTSPDPDAGMARGASLNGAINTKVKLGVGVTIGSSIVAMLMMAHA